MPTPPSGKVIRAIVRSGIRGASVLGTAVEAEAEHALGGGTEGGPLGHEVHQLAEEPGVVDVERDDGQDHADDQLTEEAKRLENWLKNGYQGTMAYMENHVF